MPQKMMHFVQNTSFSQATICRRDVTATMLVTDDKQEFFASDQGCPKCRIALYSDPSEQQRRTRHAIRMFKQGIRWFRLGNPNGTAFYVMQMDVGTAFGCRAKRKTIQRVPLHDLWPETYK